MSIEQSAYTQIVKSLAKPGEEILFSLTPHKAHLLHMAIGLAGEMAELAEAVDNRAGILEELGDLIFYLTGIFGDKVASLKDVAEHDKGAFYTLEETFFLHSCIGEIVDRIKKEVIYNRTDLEPISFAPIYESLPAFMASVGLTYEEVIAANVEKLSKRYPGLTYSDEAARLRADKA